MPGLTPRDASAALALVTAATEARYEVVGFFAGRGGWKTGTRRPGWGADGLTPLAISPRQRLDDAVKTVSDLPFGGTDCALPMLYAQARKREIDTFVIYTDSETWAGDIHPAQALRDYRRGVGHRRAAGRGRHGLERLLDRRPGRPGDARRRRLRHGDAAAHLRLRPRRPLTRRAPRAPFDIREEEEMHRHLHLVVARPEPQLKLRPAKVIQLEARRQARLEELRPKLPPTLTHGRPAA